MYSGIPRISREAIDVDSLSYDKACELYRESKPGTKLEEELLERIKFLSDPKNAETQKVLLKLLQRSNRKYDC